MTPEQRKAQIDARSTRRIELFDLSDSTLYTIAKQLNRDVYNWTTTTLIKSILSAEFPELGEYISNVLEDDDFDGNDDHIDALKDAVRELHTALSDAYQTLLSRGEQLGLDDQGPVMDKVRAALTIGTQ